MHQRPPGVDGTALVVTVALLGWGSLIWDPRPEFDQWHEAWRPDGPRLNLEFSRISQTRHGALTLVIDPLRGVPNTVTYSVSRRNRLDDVIHDLARREGTNIGNIGHVCRLPNSLSCRDAGSGKVIAAWAAARNIDAVVWTDLPSNFEQKTREPFSLDAAIRYLERLDPTGRAEAARYIRRAPLSISTPLRRAVAAEAWNTDER